MAYDRILLDITDGVATLTLNHPQTRNALSWALAEEMSDALDRLEGARVLAITGTGKAFCSGGDLASEVAEGLDFGRMMYNGIEHSVNPMLLKLKDLPIPVIAAVNGAAAGAGTPLALMADFVIAAHSAFFYMAFPNVGLVPDCGSSFILPRIIGKARAMEMMMLAERIPAAKAVDWGMIYKTVPDAELATEAQALARRLASGPTRSYALIRHALQQGAASGYVAALALEAQVQAEAGNSRDCAEAVSAFLEKRSPVFAGQ